MLTLNDGRSELWQWDTGRKLTVDADCTQVHFSNKFFGRSVDVDVVDGVAEIPDVLLQADKELLVWAFVGTAENGYTKISKVFKVNKRNKPADYVFTPTEQTTLGELIERLDKIEESQDPDAIKNAVDDYLANNPIEIDETDPTVPDWAKKAEKPKYTAQEVGAVATVNGIHPDENGDVKITIPDSSQNVDLTGYATEQWVQKGFQPKGEYLTEAPVQSVNGKTGAVKLGAGDVGARPSNWMPTAQEVGALPDTYVPPNQTAAQVGADPAGTATAAVSTHNTSTESHGDLRLALKAINDRLTAFFDSDNQTLDELSEIVAYITSNKALIDSITTSKVSVADIVNNLTTNVANKPLSAAQGVALKGLIDAVSNSLSNYQPKGDYALRSELPTVPIKVSQLENDKGYLTEHQDISGKLDADKLPEAVNNALAQAKESGEFDGADGYTPVRGVDYYTEADKEEFLSSVDAVRYVAQTLTEAQKAQARANIGASAGEDVEFADSVEWLNSNGDTSKKYVLPDGYIYAYTEKHVKVAHNANDGTGFLNMRPTGSPGSNKDANTAKNGLFTTAPIPVDGTWSSATLNISGLEKLVPTFYASLYVYYFNASGTYIAYCGNSQLFPPGSNTVLTPGNAEVEITLPVSVDLKKDANGMGYFSQSSYIRVAVGVHKTAAISDADIENLVINIDRLNKEETVYGWYSTGQQHSNDKVTQQNSADILALKEDVEALKEAVSTTPGGSGAVWYAIGDSITYGLYSTSASDYSQPVVGKRWVDYVAQFNGYKLTNLGKSGSGFVTGTTFRAIVDGNNFADVDLVTIMLGINDWKNEAAVNKVGTMDDSVGTTYTDKIIPELRYGIEKIIGQNPYCKIILITPINAKIGSRGTESTNWAYGFGGSITPCGSLKNFGDKLKEVCEYYGIQVIDMTNSSIVNRKSITTVLPDGIHPNLDCYKALGLELARRITFA